MKLEWKTEKKKLSELKGYKKNPRKISEQNKKRLEKSLMKFNLVEIPVVDIDNTIIAGHQRIKILQMLYDDNYELDCRIPNRKLTEQEKREYNLHSNSHFGEWDFSVIDELINSKDLKELDYNLDIKKIIDKKDLEKSEIKLNIKEEKLKSYKKIHILFSFHPDLFIKIKDDLEKIKNTEGVEFEQGQN